MRCVQPESAYLFCTYTGSFTRFHAFRYPCFAAVCGLSRNTDRSNPLFRTIRLASASPRLAHGRPSLSRVTSNALSERSESKGPLVAVRRCVPATGGRVRYQHGDARLIAEELVLRPGRIGRTNHRRKRPMFASTDAASLPVRGRSCDSGSSKDYARRTSPMPQC